jgi:hydroxymethylpyrimidine/phosphomethylpyrimidine kinase
MPLAADRRPAVLCIGGLDPSGGAGLLADSWAVQAAGGRPLCAATAITEQTARGVRAVHPLSVAWITGQVEALLEDEQPRAIKLGMLATAGIAGALAELLRRKRRRPPLVIDPVLRPTRGAALFRGEAPRAYRPLLALAGIVTPNLAEAEALAGVDPISDRTGMRAAGERLLAAGASVVIVKGGHLRGAALDLVLTGSGARWLSGSRLPGTARGTGCRFASALATRLALGDEPVRAARLAKQLVRAYLLEPGRQP